MLHHGGNLKSAALAFPQAPQPWIDLSTGINPVPYPFAPPSAAAWTRLPEACAIAGLEAAAARRYGAADAAGVVAAPGTQALIQWLPQLWRAKTVGILGFTYSEHGRLWRAAEAEIVTVERAEQMAHFDVAIVVNPNNPDGRLVSVAALHGLAREMTRHGGLLVVDEAFADVLPVSASLVPDLPGNALVLRSFGKAYGLAGLRLGFAVASFALAEKLRATLGPWAVSGAAVEIGTAALADGGWLATSVARLAEDGARLDRCLAAAGFREVRGTPLFRLANHPEAEHWFERLGQAGILVRPFADHRNWLRFGLPGVGEWQRVGAALSPGSEAC